MEVLSRDAVDASYIQSVADFLAANAQPVPPRASGWGVGPDALVERADDALEAENFEIARAWRRTLYDAGFGWIEGPVDLGGGGLDAAHQHAFDALAGAYELPDHVCFIVGLHIVAPTVEAFGTPGAKQRYLKGLYRGDVIGCQLFSEPDAGSDLAGVKMKGVRDGDGWRITGQKVWTSGGHHADVGEVLVRTDPDAPKHRGLTMMMVDMHAPGVTVRPLKQITGGSEFNEVFLDDVFVSDDDVLGAPGQGWQVANATLGSERQDMGGRDEGESDPSLRLIQAAQHFGITADPVVRQKLADIAIRTAVIRHTTNRYRDLANAGDPSLTGSETAVIKLLSTTRLQDIARLSGHLVGMSTVVETGDWGTFAWGDFSLLVPSHRIAGGTDEIMRNVIGERVLGLPREPLPPKT